MSVITVSDERPNWRSRKVRYSSGSWDAVIALIPEFELAPFAAAPEEPENTFLRTVVRKPLSKAERPIPVGVVSPSYSLAPHREVADLCRRGLLEAGVALDELRYEVGLSELGEWMNFRIYLGKRHQFVDKHNRTLDLRLECFNSVDGSSRLVIIFGWLRFVCANGLVIGETKIEIRERHGQGLDISAIPQRIGPALKAAEEDIGRLRAWQNKAVTMEAISAWADGALSDRWGKKAATRAFHICNDGRDVAIADPFVAGSATQKAVLHLDPVPGSPKRAQNRYDVCQALSYIATRRNDAEERVARQGDIPALVTLL